MRRKSAGNSASNGNDERSGGDKNTGRIGPGVRSSDRSRDPHSHHDSHSPVPHSHAHTSMSNIRTAFFLNLFFTVIEIFGGYFTGSIAILADALHDLGDSLSLGFSLILESLAGRKRDPTFTYGYKRFSLLAAFLNGLILLGGSGWILWETVPRLQNPVQGYTPGMIGLALVGILFNGLGALRLRKGGTLNEKMLTWHLLEDIFGWVAVLIAAIVMHFRKIPILDPLLAIGFTLFTLRNVWKIFKQTSLIFLQSVPRDVDLHLLEQEIIEQTDVHSIHDAHIWSLDGEFHVFTLHVVMKDGTSGTRFLEVKQQVRDIITRHGIDHVTVEMEHESEECALDTC